MQSQVATSYQTQESENSTLYLWTHRNMRRLLMILLVVCHGCTPNKTSNGQPDRNVEAFSLFTSPDGNFEIAFPGTPVITQTPPNPLAAKIAGSIYLVEHGDRTYGVAYSRFSVKRTDIKKELDAGRDNAARSLNAKLVKESEIEVGGHTGRDIILDLGDGSAQRIRCFLTEFELYQILLTLPKAEISSDAAEKFLSSFQLHSADDSDLPQ